MTITIDDGRVIRGPWALEVDSLRIRSGITAVVGANGAGKTSLVRAVAGLDGLDEGQLSIDEQVVDEPASQTFVPAHDRSVALVFQDHRLFDHLGAVDNVAFPLRRRGVERRVARRRAAELLDRVGLPGSHATHRPSSLSGGQKQRVAIARALAREPDVLIVDEPLASVDEASRADLRAVLAASGAGVTLLITHDPIDVQMLAARVLVLDHGRIVNHGPPADVAAAPGNEWAAVFLGANVIAGTAHGAVVTTTSGFALTVATRADGPVHVTFPAHAVTLHARRPEGSARNTWPARVERIDTDGERARITLRGPIDVRSDITRSSADSLSLVPGSTVWASLKATELAVVA